MVIVKSPTAIGLACVYSGLAIINVNICACIKTLAIDGDLCSGGSRGGGEFDNRFPTLRACAGTAGRAMATRQTTRTMTSLSSNFILL